MRKILIALIAFFVFSSSAMAISPGLVQIREADGSPSGWVYDIIVTNGGLSITGSTATISLSAGAGQPVALDLGNGGPVESADLGKIATTGDTNAIFSEPSADVLLIDVSKRWPTADVAVVANTGDSATAFFSAGVLEIGIGGTGTALTDPNANRLWGWDDTDNAIAWITLGIRWA